MWNPGWFWPSEERDQEHTAHGTVSPQTIGSPAIGPIDSIRWNIELPCKMRLWLHFSYGIPPFLWMTSIEPGLEDALLLLIYGETSAHFSHSEIHPPPAVATPRTFTFFAGRVQYSSLFINNTVLIYNNEENLFILFLEKLHVEHRDHSVQSAHWGGMGRTFQGEEYFTDLLAIA